MLRPGAKLQFARFSVQTPVCLVEGTEPCNCFLHATLASAEPQAIPHSVTNTHIQSMLYSTYSSIDCYQLLLRQFSIWYQGIVTIIGRNFKVYLSSTARKITPVMPSASSKSLSPHYHNMFSTSQVSSSLDEWLHHRASPP